MAQITVNTAFINWIGKESFLVEFGNGDKYIFDVGTGSAERIAALQIPYNYLDKVLWASAYGSLRRSGLAVRRWGFGWATVTSARVGPQRRETGIRDEVRTGIPSADVELGYSGRQGIVDERGYHIEANEFDYIRSWSAITRWMGR